MAWFPASPFKLPRRFTECATTMRVRLVYARRRYVTMEERYGLTSLNSYCFVVYGQNIKYGYSFSKLERAEHFETEIKQIGIHFLLCMKTASSTATSFKER